jgi:hypothetical protein
MNRQEIENLAVGDFLQNTFDVVAGTSFTKLQDGARWSQPRRIVSILYRGISAKGRAYVGGYTEHGPNGSISFGIAEDEVNYRKVDR